MKNITWMQVYVSNNKLLTPVIRQTEKGQSAYANKMYRKYGDGMRIIQYHFNNDLNIVIDMTWGA